MADTISSARGYLARGWALVELHHMRGPEDCSCGSSDPNHWRGQGGKHPIRMEWQRFPLRDTRAWEQQPQANIGIVTGSPSGIWVLDVDPLHQGDERLAELEARHGALPQTYTVVTGSGGRHLYWRMPAWHIGGSRGRLPAGLDVRGTGSQVVAPPSVSGRGPYCVALDTEPVDAPPWLLDLVRPSSREIAAPPGGLSAAQVREQLGEADRARGRAYAAQAVSSCLAELADTTEGGRNERAFATACRLLELIRAPWSGLDGPAVYLAFVDACERAGARGQPFPVAEAEQCWRNADRAVGAKVAELPPSTVLAPEPLPFGSAPPAGSVSPFSEPGQHQPAGAGAGLVDPVDALIGQMLDAERLRQMPPPQPLVRDVLDLDSLAWIIGRSGTYKSFVALSLAAAVGGGQTWMGYPVAQRLVIYVVAEGAAGMTLRVAAWEEIHGPMHGVLFLPRPVQADERRARSEWSVLVEACRRLQPGLVILDTQARVTVGLKENDNTDMGLFIEQAARLQRASGACVLTVHHQGRTGADARGASAIDGAQDVELRVERLGDLRIAVRLDKVKDGSDAPVIQVVLKRIERGRDPQTGRDLSSLVALDAASNPLPPVDPEWRAKLGDTQAKIVSALVDNFAAVGGTKPEVFTVVRERWGELSKSSLHSAWTTLVSKGVVMRVDGSQRYVLASTIG